MGQKVAKRLQNRAHFITKSWDFPTEQIRCEHTIVRQKWASSDNILSFPTRPDKMWPSCRFENHCAYWHTPATLPDN